VAKSTRQQRRERRQQAGDGGAARTRARQSQVRAVEPAKSERAATTPLRRRGRVLGFIGESWAELKKVEWPGQNQVIQGTVVVLVACTIVGIYLYANDLIWKRVVQWVLGQ
jgi:preprotein translocase subunit SecE